MRLQRRTYWILFGAAVLILAAAPSKGLLAQNSVVSAEYFFDVDPGEGLATQLTLAPGGFVDISQLVSVSGLSQGTHKLYVRTKDQSGRWGVAVGVAFVITQPGTGERTIAQAEYFFNSDPGISAANPLTVSESPSVNVEQSASIAGLPKAEHTLFVRMKSGGGEWGQPVGQKFVVTDSIMGNVITGAEYFFDADPGEGNGSFFPLTSFTAFQDVTTDAVLAGLSAGAHKLFVRVRDDKELWGNPVATSFVVSEPPTGKRSIAAAEYFFDNDPGNGNGNSLAFSSNNIITVLESASLAGLLNGEHNAFVRTKNGLGEWGNPIGTRFIISPARFVAGAEYFVDVPGAPAGGSPMAALDSVFDSPAEYAVATLDTSLAQAGKHEIFVRVRDSEGRWSAVGRDSLLFEGTVGVAYSPTNIVFGNVTVGEVKDTILTISNTGVDTLKVMNISSTNSVFEPRPTARNIPGGQSFQDTIRFAPASGGLASGMLLVSTNASIAPDTIALSGFGAIYSVQISSKDISFSNVQVGLFKDTTITISNTGNDTLRIFDIVSEDTIFSASPRTFVVAPGADAIDTVRFKPTVADSVSGALIVISNAGSSPDTIRVSGVGDPPTGVERFSLPTVFALSQNYPNPFNPATLILYQLPRNVHVSIRAYNILGQVVEVLVDEQQEPGYYRIHWSPRLPSGVYFYRMSAGEFTEARKLILLR